MANEARLRYGTFSLRAAPDGVVHLEGDLPEVIALGTDAWVEFVNEVWPLGGPHAEATIVAQGQARLHVVTPEAQFTYEFVRVERDTAGWYLVMRLTFTDSTYRAFLAGH